MKGESPLKKKGEWCYINSFSDKRERRVRGI
jgi:hypothetical protein